MKTNLLSTVATAISMVVALFLVTLATFKFLVNNDFESMVYLMFLATIASLNGIIISMNIRK